MLSQIISLILFEKGIAIAVSPINPINKGKMKLKNPGKKPVKLMLKKEFNETSKILMKNKKIPLYK